MNLLAHAKVNWALDVLGRRNDGYHLLDMLMESVSLCDRLTITPANSLTMTISGRPTVPMGDDNLVMRAAKRMQDAFGISNGAHIHLEKRIPVGAGLGGGSADAAAVLHGLSALWEIHAPPERLAAIGCTLGADIPFCMTGGLCRVRGIGETLSPEAAKDTLELLIIKPCQGLSTKAVFDAYDQMPAPRIRPDVAQAFNARAQGDVALLAQSMGNALHMASIRMRPDIAICAQAMEHFGAIRAQMTGSGSAVVGFFDSATAADHAYLQCVHIWPSAIRTRTHDCGLERPAV